jgi:hypothetical protein
LFLDYAHGVALGQDRILSEPHYRIRQSLAIALSRLHDPPLGGYLAYGSIVGALNEHGFAVFDSDNGKVLSGPEMEVVLDDGPQLDRVLTMARNVQVDPKLPPEIIGGNELGYADYIELAFRLFGVRVAALYYFYFLLLGLSCLLFAIEFRSSAALVYVLVLFEASVYFLINYAHSIGVQINTIANSRIFSALTLPAAAHVLFVVWRGKLPSISSAALVAVQCIVIAFMITARYEVMWQALMIFVTAVALGVGAWLRASDRRHGFRRVSAHLWPAVILGGCMVIGNLHVSLTAAPQYASETKTHVFWHSVLMGLLVESLPLWKIYVGGNDPEYVDTSIYKAIERDYAARHQAAPSLALDPAARSLQYERYARALALRIIVQHPVYVAEGLVEKLREQVRMFSIRNAMAFANLQFSLWMGLIAALACALAGGMTARAADLLQGAALMVVFLAFALTTTIIEPTVLAAGTLLTYLVAGAVAVSYVVVFAIAGIFEGTDSHLRSSRRAGRS